MPWLCFGPFVVAGPVIAAVFGVPGWKIAALWAGGLGSWIVAEYLIHRFVFHFRPRAIWLKRQVYYLHEHHHRYQEWDRLVAPPLMSLSFAAIFLAIAYATVGPWYGWPRVLAFLGGFVAGYVWYDHVHFTIHFVRPRTAYGRFLRRCHWQHHFAHSGRWFCVSFPWLDYLFGTHLRREDLKQPHAESWEDEALPRAIREFERQAQARQAALCTGEPS